MNFEHTENIQKENSPAPSEYSEMKPHVLVVEDEINLAVGIRFSLEHENYQVTLIHDGAEALEQILHTPTAYDVIVLDIMLPGLNGYSVCSQIREKGITTPIMFLSARTLPEDKARGFDAGANQYMPKPFELEEFLARIRNMLKLKEIHSASKNKNLVGYVTEKDAENESVKKSTEKGMISENTTHSELPAELKIGEAVVKFNALEVQTPKKTVRLTSLEMSLLKYFILNANRLIAKEELLEKVWKMPGAMNTRAPDQFILRLRKIFEQNPAKPLYFRTYRNAGYRFTPDPENDMEKDTTSKK
ncbi:MAG: response regulator transcription factor [Planctomycetia bacterium]|nr:response regulator transcription factor [Planctomycetia bacterium]